MTKPPKSDRVYVSAFLTDHVIEKAGEAVHFTLEGAGIGHWDLGDADIISIIADLFISIAWIEARPGTYQFDIYIALASGERIDVHRTAHEIATTHFVRTSNVPMTGIDLPLGYHLLWIEVDGARKCGIPMRVFGDKDPGGPVEPNA